MSHRIIKDKYAKRKDSAGRMKYPAGGADMMYLCSMVEGLELLVRKAQRLLPAKEQNVVEIGLFRIMNSKGR